MKSKYRSFLCFAFFLITFFPMVTLQAGMDRENTPMGDQEKRRTHLQKAQSCHEIDDLGTIREDPVSLEIQSTDPLTSGFVPTSLTVHTPQAKAKRSTRRIKNFSLRWKHKIQSLKNRFNKRRKTKVRSRRRTPKSTRSPRSVTLQWIFVGIAFALGLAASAFFLTGTIAFFMELGLGVINMDLSLTLATWLGALITGGLGWLTGLTTHKKAKAMDSPAAKPAKIAGIINLIAAGSTIGLATLLLFLFVILIIAIIVS